MLTLHNTSDMEDTNTGATEVADTKEIIQEVTEGDVSQYLITYTMKTSSYRPTKSVKAIKAHNKDFYDLKDERRTTGTLYLLEDRFTCELAQFVRKTRDFFEDNTHRLGFTSVIPSRNYFRVYEYTQNDIPEFFKKCKDFEDNWVEGLCIRDTSYESLGDKLKKILQNEPIWKMTPEEVALKNYFHFSKVPVGDTATIRNLRGVTEDMRKGIEADLLDQNKKIEEACIEQTVKKLRKKVGDFRQKFNGYREDYTRVSPSITKNIADFAELIPDLLVNEDTQLVELAQEAKILAAWDIDILKESELARKEAVTKAEDILSKLSL